MFESLKSRLHTALTSPVERRFEERQAYNQDDPNRALRLLFFKLLMVVAAADDQVTTEEVNLLKDFVFEYSLTEQEWAEIQYYAGAHLSKNELEQLIETVAGEIRSRSDREQFERAIGEMLEADSLLSGGEKEIADVVHADVKRVHLSPAAYVYKTLRVAWRRRLQLPAAVASLEDEAKVYGRNPVAALLHREGVMPAHGELAGAKLGLILLVIRSDELIDQKETTAFERYVANECGLSSERAARLTKRLLAIPEELLQLTYLARTLVDAMGAAERQQYFEQLVQIARADGVEVLEEGRALRMIEKYLYLDPGRESAP